MYLIGQRVEGLFDTDWYPGSIKKRNGDGTYVIEFDDGDIVNDIIEDELRLINNAEKEEPEKEYTDEYNEDRIVSHEDGCGSDHDNDSNSRRLDVTQLDRHNTQHIYDDEPDDNDDFKYVSSNPVAHISPHESSNMAEEDEEESPLRRMHTLPSYSTSSNESEQEVDPELTKAIAQLLQPAAYTRYSESVKNDSLDTFAPNRRLEYLSLQVAVAEHIRSIQCLYMDAEDDLMLCRDLRQRCVGFQTKLSTKSLMQMITGGRSRLVALVRLNHGNNSIVYVRALLDLANSYALQGLWEQVAQYISIAKNVAADISMQDNDDALHKKRRLHARLVCILLAYIRDHSIMNNGQINESIIKEICALLGVEVQRYISIEGMCGDPSEADAVAAMRRELEAFFVLRRFGQWQGQPLHKQQQQQEEEEDDDARGESSPSTPTPTHGELLTYLRSSSLVFSQWMTSVHSIISPQSLAILRLLLINIDAHNIAAISPSSFIQACADISAASRLLVGTGLLEWLRKLNTEARVLMNTATGSISDVALGKSEYDDSHERVVIPLHVAFEELLAKYSCDNMDQDSRLLAARLLTLQGMVHVYTRDTIAAEENFIQALRIMESIGIEMDVSACELYNSVAQLMITRHRNWQDSKKNKSKQEALSWLSSTEGQLAVQNEVVRLMKGNIRSYRRASKEEVEMKAYKKVFIERWRQIRSTAVDPTITSVEAASRYLLRSFEIIETCHGSSHAAYGAACIAIASVKSIMGEYEATREWLARALRSMEKLIPVPERAVAFVQTQLSQVLSRQRHTEEAVQVLSHSALFHMEKAKAGLMHAGAYTAGSGLFSVGIHRGQPVYNDVMRALDQTTKIMNMSLKTPELAIELAENMAELADSAFGWDSNEAAQCRREVGLRYKQVEMWKEAKSHFRRALESHEALFGADDNRTAAMRTLLTECDANIPSFEFDGIGEPYKHLSKIGFLKTVKEIRRKHLSKS